MFLSSSSPNSPLDRFIHDSFESCIHVTLGLPRFQEHQRAKLWVQILHALEMDDANLSVHSEILKYLEHDRGLKTLQWNGKQMRNGRSFDSTFRPRSG